MASARSHGFEVRSARVGGALPAVLLAAHLLPALHAPAAAQASFPTKQVTIVVPFAAGGQSDAMARLIAQGLGDKIGARVIVENVAGAGGTIGSARASRAEPTGT